MDDQTSGVSHGATSHRKRSRKISNLTQEQIQQKRIADRRAQRAFRQRTKDCISNLELQFSELKEASGRKDEEIESIRKENEQLRVCLEAAHDLIAVALGRKAYDQGHDNNHREGDCIDMQSSTSDAGGLDSIDESEAEHIVGAGDRLDPGSDDEIRMPNLESPRPSSPRQLPVNNSHRDLMDESTQSSRNQAGSSEYNIVGTTMTTSVTSEPLPSTNIECQPSPPGGNTYNQYITDSLRTSLATPAASATSVTSRHNSCLDFPTPGSTTMSTSIRVSPSSPPFMVLPQHLPSTCPLDQILLDFLQSHKEMLSSGVDVNTVIGSQRPTVAALIDDRRAGTVHPISDIMSRVLSTFPHVKLPQKLAFFYLMYHTTRWQIHPTKEAYTAMPSWLRPTVTQITMPHPIWIDNIPWPRVRDLLIENPDQFPFQLFSDNYSQHVTVNWNFDDLDAVAHVGDDIFLHSIFEKHIRKIENWTVSLDFYARFPSLASALRSHD